MCQKGLLNVRRHPKELLPCLNCPLFNTTALQTLTIPPRSRMRSSSASMLGRSGTGTILGHVIAWSLAPQTSAILYRVFMSPSPTKWVPHSSRTAAQHDGATFGRLNELPTTLRPTPTSPILNGLARIKKSVDTHTFHRVGKVLGGTVALPLFQGPDLVGCLQCVVVAISNLDGTPFKHVDRLHPESRMHTYIYCQSASRVAPTFLIWGCPDYVPMWDLVVDLRRLKVQFWLRVDPRHFQWPYLINASAYIYVHIQ